MEEEERTQKEKRLFKKEISKRQKSMSNFDTTLH